MKQFDFIVLDYRNKVMLDSISDDDYVEMCDEIIGEFLREEVVSKKIEQLSSFLGYNGSTLNKSSNIDFILEKRYEEIFLAMSRCIGSKYDTMYNEFKIYIMDLDGGKYSEIFEGFEHWYTQAFIISKFFVRTDNLGLIPNINEALRREISDLDNTSLMYQILADEEIKDVINAMAKCDIKFEFKSYLDERNLTKNFKGMFRKNSSEQNLETPKVTDINEYSFNHYSNSNKLTIFKEEDRTKRGLTLDINKFSEEECVIMVETILKSVSKKIVDKKALNSILKDLVELEISAKERSYNNGSI